MDELYLLVYRSIIASPVALAFGVVVSVCVAATILWLQYPLKSRRLAMDQGDQVRSVDPPFLKLEEPEPVGSSAELEMPFAGVHAALRKARANDVGTKVSPVKDSRRKRAGYRISKPPASDTETSRYPGAFTAIEYRDEIRTVWEAIGQLSDVVRRELLSALETNPQVDARELAATILRKLEEERRRFDSDELKDACRAAAQISEDAAEEFRRVILLLGPTVDPDRVLVKLRQKYATRDYPSE